MSNRQSKWLCVGWKRTKSKKHTEQARVHREGKKREKERKKKKRKTHRLSISIFEVARDDGERKKEKYTEWVSMYFMNTFISMAEMSESVDSGCRVTRVFGSPGSRAGPVIPRERCMTQVQIAFYFTGGTSMWNTCTSCALWSSQVKLCASVDSSSLFIINCQVSLMCTGFLVSSEVRRAERRNLSCSRYLASEGAAS